MIFPAINLYLLQEIIGNSQLPIAPLRSDKNRVDFRVPGQRLYLQSSNVNVAHGETWTNKKLLKMAIEIVDFPIKNGWIFPWQNVNVHQRVVVISPKK